MKSPESSAYKNVKKIACCLFDLRFLLVAQIIDLFFPDLDLNALGAAAAATTAAATPITNPVAESPPRQATGTSLAYSHPQRQEHEAFTAATSGTSPRTQGNWIFTWLVSF